MTIRLANCKYVLFNDNEFNYASSSLYFWFIALNELINLWNTTIRV